MNIPPKDFQHRSLRSLGNSPEITARHSIVLKSQPETSVRDFSQKLRSLAQASGCENPELISGLFLSIIVLFFSACPRPACGDEPTAEIQIRCTDICQQLQAVTVRIRSGSDVSSGVIVSADGLVLTVAHGLKPDAATTVIVSGGQAFEAKRVFVDESADIAILSFDLASPRGSDIRFLSLSTDALTAAGEIAIAAGFPAKEPDGMTAVIRLGQILAVDDSAIKTSCTLTSGDSGGPLVNSRGELIGLNRQIGKSAESNGHIRISAILRVLEQTDSWKKLPQQSRANPLTPLSSKGLLPEPFVVQMARQATVEIHGTDRKGSSAVRACGTILDKLHVATKLSEIVFCEKLECHFTDGSKTLATLSKQDRARDLAILTMQMSSKHGVVIRAGIAEAKNDVSLVGRIVFAATSPVNISAAGLISRDFHKEPSQPARFGATMQEDGEHVRITELSPNSSAVIAGLKADDEILRLNGKAVISLDAIGNLLQLCQPGDWIVVDIKRGKNELKIYAQLQHDPRQQFEKTEFLDGRAGELSQRRNDFQALQHDIAITPAACGGPLLDIDGHIIGINIARRARESTLALPIDIVVQFANNKL